jgi:predicted aconitase with swiveling domain
MAEARVVRALTPGLARGPALVLDEPLSFWGGLDPATGRVIDAHHPQVGSMLAGAVVSMPSGRGSSSSSYVFAEAIRAGTAPAAVVLGEADAIVALCAIVAAELYGIEVPVVVAPGAGLATGDMVTVRSAGGDDVSLVVD